MVIAHIVVLSSALVTVLGTVTAVRRADDRARRRSWHRRRPRDDQAYRELDRAVHNVGRPIAARHHLDQIAWDLRRLNHQRYVGAGCGIRPWLDQMYDKKLCLACECLGVQEHLEPLHGVDREIERLRVEHALQAAGVTLRP